MHLFKFLVFIDDDAATNYYHEHILNEYDICEKYLFFSSADEALEYFKSNELCPHHVMPEFIFSDINMPRTNGWEFVEQFENLLNSKSSKICMLTTSSDPYEKKKISQYERVANYCEKPLSKKILLGLSEQY